MTTTDHGVTITEIEAPPIESVSQIQNEIMQLKSSIENLKKLLLPKRILKYLHPNKYD